MVASRFHVDTCPAFVRLRAGLYARLRYSPLLRPAPVARCLGGLQFFSSGTAHVLARGGGLRAGIDLRQSLGSRTRRAVSRDRRRVLSAVRQRLRLRPYGGKRRLLDGVHDGHDGGWRIDGRLHSVPVSGRARASLFERDIVDVDVVVARRVAPRAHAKLPRRLRVELRAAALTHIG